MAYPTDQQIDDAVPVAGTPSRALTNAALKAITANATFLPNEGTVPLRSIENENFSGGRIKASFGTDPDDCVTLLQLELHNTPWDQVTGKPSVFAPIIGTTSTTAKAGNYQPAWSDIDGKPVGTPMVEITSATVTLAAAAHAGKWLKLNSASAQTITIGTDAASAWAADTEMQWHQHGTGVPTFIGASGVTIRKHSSITATGLGQYAPGGLKRVGANEWLLFGQMGAA